MKATYQDFLDANPNCSRLAQNRDAIALFDFLNTDASIIKMTDSCEMGKPALAGCVTELEQYYDSLVDPSVDMTKAFTRTAVGRMIKTVLAPFGYHPVAQKMLSKECRGDYFASGSCYALSAPATMRVVKRVEEA